MARVTLNDVDKYKGGGSSFFRLEDGEKKSVRFLFNNIQEVNESPIAVHEFTGNKFATIDCCRGPEESADSCKWCSMGNNPVTRVVIPIYEEGSNEIQYWKKSGTFVKDTLVPLFENLPSGAPISGQSFIISRTGKDWKNTKYAVAPDLRKMNDMKTKDAFGEVKDPFELNIIKPNDFDFDPNSEASEPSQSAATRRTADVF